LVEENYIDGKRNGIFKSYWVNGQLYSEVNYIDGKRNGKKLKIYFLFLSVKNKF